MSDDCCSQLYSYYKDCQFSNKTLEYMTKKHSQTEFTSINQASKELNVPAEVIVEPYHLVSDSINDVKSKYLS